MDRKQAVDIVKEILNKCRAMEGKSLKLLPPREDDTLSHTFQIHIETKDDPVVQGCVESITKVHNLAAKMNDDWLIIYKPYAKKR